MRPPRPALLLALAACTLENPAFKAGPQGVTGGGTTAGESTTTGRETDPAVPTTTAPTTTRDPGSSTSSGSTSEPLTSTDALTSSTSEPMGDLPGECDLTVAGDTHKYAFNVSTNQPVEGCAISRTWKTKASMKGGVLTILDAVNCETMEEHDTIRLGEGYPTTQPDRDFDCAEVNVFWHPAEPGKCRIGTIWVKDLQPEMGLPYYVYAASLNHPGQPPGFPLWPKRLLVDESCGCGGLPGCCVPEAPGEYKLAFDAFGEVFPDTELQFDWGTKMFRIFNIQSYVDSTCTQADPNAPLPGHHFDWFGEEVLR